MTDKAFDYWERKAECRAEEFGLLLESEEPLKKVKELIVGAERLLVVGTKVAQFVHPLIDDYLTWGAQIDFGSLQGPQRTRLEFTRERLCCFGLLTHCLLFSSDNRLRYEDVDRDGLYAVWARKTPTAHATLSPYNKDRTGVPEAIFATQLKRVELVQKAAGLGWWRRGKDRAIYHHCFASGVLLGMLYDMETKRLADEWGTRDAPPA